MRNKRLTEKVNCKSFQFRKWDHFSNIFKEIYSQHVSRIKMENLTPLIISCHCIAVSIAWILSTQKLSFKVRKPLHSYAFGLFLYSFLPSAAPRYLAEERQHCGFFTGSSFPHKTGCNKDLNRGLLDHSHSSNKFPSMSSHETQLSLGL